MGFAASAPEAALFFALAGIGHGACWSPMVCGWSIDITGSSTMAFNMGFAVALLSVAALVPLMLRPRLALRGMV